MYINSWISCKSTSSVKGHLLFKFAGMITAYGNLNNSLTLRKMLLGWVLKKFLTAVLSCRILFLRRSGILPLCHVASTIIMLPILDLREEQTSAHIFLLCISSSLFFMCAHISGVNLTFWALAQSGEWNRTFWDC